MAQAQLRPFDRATLEAAFERLGEIAAAAGKIVEISVYGGSALVLTLSHRPATRDVDAVFEEDRAFVRRAVEVVAAEFGWPEDWLNDSVKAFLSRSDTEPGAKSLFRTFPAGDVIGLRVLVASPAYLFAMKCLSMRVADVSERGDVDDIRALGAALGVKTASEAIDLVARYYPAEALPPKTRFRAGGDFRFQPPMRRSTFRPLSIAEIAERVSGGTQSFDLAVREFLDSWQTLSRAERRDALAEEPVPAGRVEDAYLAALAEHLASEERLDAAQWTEAPQRFLREPYFAGGLESLKAMLIVESPSAFRRRLLFISADGLSRPHSGASAEELSGSGAA